MWFSRKKMIFGKQRDLSRTHTRSLSLCRALSHTLCLSHTLARTHTHTHARTNANIYTLSHTNSLLSITHTHTRTRTQAHIHTLSHTQSLWNTCVFSFTIKRDNAVYGKIPRGRSIIISYATVSVTRLAERIFLKVCRVVFPFVGGLWSHCEVCNTLLGDRAFDDLSVCVWCRICSKSVCLSLLVNGSSNRVDSVNGRWWWWVLLTLSTVV